MTPHTNHGALEMDALGKLVIALALFIVLLTIIILLKDKQLDIITTLKHFMFLK